MVVAGPVAAQDLQPVPVPSGLEIALADVMLEPEPPLARFRFVAPAIGGDTGLTFADVADDLGWLCEALVIPALDQQGWDGDRVVLSVSDRPTDFGIYDPDVVQFFQPFRLEGDTCAWDDT